MNQDIFKGKWEKLKGSIKKTWGKLSDDDLNKIKGQKDKLIGLIQETYGEAKEEIEKKIQALLKEIE